MSKKSLGDLWWVKEGMMVMMVSDARKVLSAWVLCEDVVVVLLLVLLA